MAVIVALAVAATDLQLGSSDADTVARSATRRTAWWRSSRPGIGEGALLPHEILVGGGTDPERVAAEVRSVEGIHGAVAPQSWTSGETAIVEAIPVPDSGTEEGGETLTPCRTPPTRPVRTCGSAASRPPTPTSSTRSTGASR